MPVPMLHLPMSGQHGGKTTITILKRAICQRDTILQLSIEQIHVIPTSVKI
ncbi:hypothetical protein VPMS16_300 [Vibrio sp. 16]|nr:hypothetical protein VPMS16_300 [Vibrio sp. 16]